MILACRAARRRCVRASARARRPSRGVFLESRPRAERRREKKKARTEIGGVTGQIKPTALSLPLSPSAPPTADCYGSNSGQANGTRVTGSPRAPVRGSHSAMAIGRRQASPSRAPCASPRHPIIHAIRSARVGTRARRSGADLGLTHPGFLSPRTLSFYCRHRT